MSGPSDRADDLVGDLRSRLVGWEDWYPIPILTLFVAFALWVRLQAIDRFTVGGQVFFTGNDAYYHLREVMYVVTHWPWTMPFDPWSYFPYGTAQGQFGTLFDQLIATAAIIVGFGDPSEQTVAFVHLVAPAIFGAATMLPVYAIGKRFGDRVTGLMAAGVLLLLPGSFLSRTTVGFTDHNSAEPFFQALAVLGVIVAIHVVEAEKPVFEQVVDRDWDGLRRPVGWSILGGFAIFTYIWVWPPGIFLVGLLAVFFTIALAYNFVRGRSPDHLALAGIVMMTELFLLLLLRLDTVQFATTQVSGLHLLLSLGVGAGCAFMAVLARLWEGRNLPTLGYPATVTVLLFVGAALFSVLLPAAFGTLRTNVTRIFAFGQSDTTLTVVEARAVPLDSLGQFLVGEYGLTVLTAAVGLLVVWWRVSRRRDYSSAAILLMVWAVATTMMAMTQVRFNYYLASVVAVLSAIFLSWLLAEVGVESVDSLRRLETYQAMTLLTVIVIVVAPLTPVMAGPSVVEEARATSPGSSVVWGDGLEWLAEQTPPEGTYGGANNEMAYYGTYERTDDFSYPAGAYGVMSWWDYGHWITVMGERIPNANPFQQGPQIASAFLQTSDEERSVLLLEALPSTNAPYQRSNEELEEIIADQSAQHSAEDTRYVAIDHQMAGGKFSAIATWTGPGSTAYFEQSRYQIQKQNVTLPSTNARYDETMMSTLYFDDASGLSHYRLVHEVDQYALVGGYIPGQRVNPLTSLRLNGDWESLGPTAAQIRSAKGSGQAVRIGEGQYVYDAEVESRVKLYERVEGATLTGTASAAENGTPVFAFLQLRTDDGRNVSYAMTTEIGPDGSFTMTVPYSTDNTVGPADGGTNTSVEAAGNYTVVVGNPFTPSATGRVDVPEPAVYEGREIPVELSTPQEGNQSVDGNDSSTADTSGAGSLRAARP